jgi:hypothetical protein
MITLPRASRLAALAFVALFATGFAGSAMAASTFDKDHPRRAEVNHRLNKQDKRIDRKEHEGKISRHQAAKLHHEDHQIRHEERAMASQNHGHITKTEQRALNQQENHVSRQIRSE